MPSGALGTVHLIGEEIDRVADNWQLVVAHRETVLPSSHESPAAARTRRSSVVVARELVAFIAYCLQVTFKHRARSLALGLTPPRIKATSLET